MRELHNLEDSKSYLHVSEMIGMVFVNVERKDGYDGDEIHFELENGAYFKLFHSQDCCESVRIEEIHGNLEDLVGTTIISASEDSKDMSDVPDENGYKPESATATWYTFRTHKGTVVMRWYGSSNGYYSESVSLSFVGIPSWARDN